MALSETSVRSSCWSMISRQRRFVCRICRRISSWPAIAVELLPRPHLVIVSSPRRAVKPSINEATLSYVRMKSCVGTNPENIARDEFGD